MKKNVKELNEKMMKAEEWSVNDYKKLLNIIIDMSMDAECFNLDGNFSNTEIQKCRQIRKMIEVITDVPQRRVDWIIGGKWKEYAKRRKTA